MSLKQRINGWIQDIQTKKFTTCFGQHKDKLLLFVSLSFILSCNTKSTDHHAMQETVVQEYDTILVYSSVLNSEPAWVGALIDSGNSINYIDFLNKFCSGSRRVYKPDSMMTVEKITDSIQLIKYCSYDDCFYIYTYSDIGLIYVDYMRYIEYFVKYHPRLDSNFIDSTVQYLREWNANRWMELIPIPIFVRESTIPLLEPYALLQVTSKTETDTWECKLDSLPGIAEVKHVAVQDSIIYVLGGQVDGSAADSIHIQNIGKVLTAWYVLDTRTRTKEEKVFVSEADFLSYIKANNVPLPQWYHIDSLACMKKLPWEAE